MSPTSRDNDARANERSPCFFIISGVISTYWYPLIQKWSKQAWENVQVVTRERHMRTLITSREDSPPRQRSVMACRTSPSTLFIWYSYTRWQDMERVAGRVVDEPDRSICLRRPRGAMRNWLSSSTKY